MLILEKPAQVLAASDDSYLLADLRPRLQDPVIQSLVRSFAMILWQVLDHRLLFLVVPAREEGQQHQPGMKDQCYDAPAQRAVCRQPLRPAYAAGRNGQIDILSSSKEVSG